MRPSLYEAPASAFLILIVQAFMIFFLFFSLLYDVAELTLFTLIILAMGFGSYLWSQASLNHVECKITLNRVRLFPGERLKIYVQAINSKLLPFLFKVDLFVPKAIVDSEAGRWISAESSLLWYQQYVFSKEFFPNKRGVYDLGPPKLKGGDLFGFFFKNKEIKERFEIVVYPRIVNIRSITLPKREFYGIPGTQSPVEDPVFVFGTREYQPGRPARKIHWKASARYNLLLEKLCEPAEQEKVLILFDVDKFENEQAKEAFERTLEVIASLILQLDRRGIAVGFATNGNILGGGPRIIPISRSPLQMASILEALARLGEEKTGRVTDILSRGYRIPGGVSSIYFAHSRCDLNHFTREFLKNRNVPVRFVMAQKLNDMEITDNPQEKDIYYMDNILVQENPKK
jgi:uncharacterized protein (DUF58 family)